MGASRGTSRREGVAPTGGTFLATARTHTGFTPSGDRDVSVHFFFRKTVYPLLPVRWLALHCASEGCSGGPSRSSSQEDEPCQIIGKHLSESMSQSLGTPSRLRMPAGREKFASSARSTPRMRACAELSSGSPTGSIAFISATRPPDGRPQLRHFGSTGSMCAPSCSSTDLSLRAKTLKPVAEADDDDGPGAAANAVMMSICSVPSLGPNTCVVIRGQAFVPARSAKGMSKTRQRQENMSTSIQTAILDWSFSKPLVRLLPAERAGTAFAKCDAATLSEGWLHADARDSPLLDPCPSLRGKQARA